MSINLWKCISNKTKGPIGSPTIVSDIDELKRIFGEPDEPFDSVYEKMFNKLEKNIIEPITIAKGKKIEFRYE